MLILSDSIRGAPSRAILRAPLAMQAVGGERWDIIDLIRRVQNSLDIAGSAVTAALHLESQSATTPGRNADPTVEKAFSNVLPLKINKVVAEAAMLLRCVIGLPDGGDRLASSSDELARKLLAPARGERLLASLCREPASALESASAHIHLADIGYPNAAVDSMLDEVAQGDDLAGPERLPNHALEFHWLGGIRSGVRGNSFADALARTCIARPLDTLGSATRDLYAFTHVVLYGSDLGRRACQWPRRLDEIAEDADAALAAAIDADNFDLAAELIWTWPMLQIPWSSAATFCFGVLAAAQDEHGFLPGPGYSASAHASLPDELQNEYILRTSYHTTFVMGFACAAALRSNLAPPIGIDPAPRLDRVVEGILELLPNEDHSPRWRDAFARLCPGSSGSLAGFLLAILLRRARSSNNLELLRQGLDMGLRFDLLDGPAVRQALALLRRAAVLGKVSNAS